MIREGWFYIYGIIYVTAVDLRISKHEGNERSVNLALDTVLEFNNKDNKADMSFLDNVQKFIGKVKTVIAKKSLKRRNFNSVNNEKLTDFILNLIEILNKFNDTDLEYFFDITADEMTKYHYKGCKFHELIANSYFRKSLANKLAVIKNAPASVLRRKLDAISDKIEEETYDAHEKDLIDFLNSLYGESSVTLFHRILSNLDDYRLKSRVNMDLQKIISKAIRSVLFDYYTELNSNARMALQAKLDEYYNNNINKGTTAKTIKPTAKAKYINQYAPLKRDIFKNSNRSPRPRAHVTYKEVDSLQVQSDELRHHKRKKHAEKFNEQQQLIHSKKSKTHINPQDFDDEQYKPKYMKTSKTIPKQYFKKDTIEKMEPYAYEHSKMAANGKERTGRNIYPITSSDMNELPRAEMPIDSDNSQNSDYFKFHKHSYKTPNEPDIDSDTYQNEELVNYKTTKSQKRPRIIFHAIKTTVKPKLSDYMQQTLAKGELSSFSITSTDRQPVVTLYPLHSDIDEGETIKQRVDRLYIDKVLNKEPKPNLDLELNLTPVKINNPSDGTHKYSDTDYISNDDKLSSHNVKNPDHNLKLMEKLDVIQKLSRNAKTHKLEHSTTPTIGPDSVEFIAFEDDDLGGIDERLNLKHKAKMPHTTDNTTPKKAVKRMNTRRGNSNKLTFMTLYPEFIKKWTTLNSKPAYRFRAHDNNTKKKVKHRNRDGKYKFKQPDLSIIDMAPHIPQGIQNIINAKSGTRAKTDEMLYQTKTVDTKRANIKYKATTSEFKKQEITKSKGMQIIEENLKRLNNPEVYAKLHGLVPSGGNIERTYPANSEDNVFTEESTEKTHSRIFQRRSMNISRDGPFIDLNILNQHQTNSDGNIRFVGNQAKQKEMRVDNLNEEEDIPQNKDETINERGRQTNIKNVNAQRVSNLGRLVTNKESSKNAIETDKQWMNSYRNDRKDNEHNGANIFNGKEFILRTYNPDVDKHTRKSRRGFIDLQAPKEDNVDVPEVISNQENISHLDQDTHTDRKPIYTSRQTAKRDVIISTVHNTQNYNDVLYDTTRKKKIYFSYSNDDNTDWARNKEASKLINKNKPVTVKSNEENLRYSPNKKVLEKEKKSNDVQHEMPKLVHTSTVLSNQFIQGKSNSDKDAINIKNVEKDFLKFDNQNTVNRLYAETPLEEEVRKKSDNNEFQKDREVDESETVHININKNLMTTQKTIVRQAAIEDFTKIKNDRGKTRSSAFIFRAKDGNALENITNNDSNFKSSVTSIEPITVTTAKTEEVTTHTTNIEVIMKTESTKTVKNESAIDIKDRTDLKFSSSVTERILTNSDIDKLDKITKETSFSHTISNSKLILDNVTKTISDDNRQEITNIRNNFNGTTNSFK